MLTFKPIHTINEQRSNNCQNFLTALLRRELRGMSVGFLLVREFGVRKTANESPDASHFHVVLTDPIPDKTVKRFQRAFVRHCGLPDNKTKVFHYTTHVREGEPRFGEYVSKLEKWKIDVINPPHSWDYRKLIRCYQSGFL